LGPIGAIGRSRGREGAFYLPLPVSPVVKNSDLSPREDPAVGNLPRLDEDFFQALADEISARGGTGVSVGRQRRPLFCADPAL
jgi:hypothetical protein